jgi:hypothetical protein
MAGQRFAGLGHAICSSHCELDIGEIVMVSFSESIYRGYRITAWAQGSLELADGEKTARFAAHAVVAGTAAAVMDYRLPVPDLEAPLFAQPASARHHAEAMARAYIDELRQAHAFDPSFERDTVHGYRRERGSRASQAAA